jgi:hypothetical protein
MREPIKQGKYSYTQEPDKPHTHSYAQETNHMDTSSYKQENKTDMRKLIAYNVKQRKPKTPASSNTWRTQMPSICSFRRIELMPSNNNASPSKLHSTFNSARLRSPTYSQACRRQT